MSNRWIRFLLAVLAIAAASAATYRVVQDEQRLARENAVLRDAAFWADTALLAVEEIKASLHASVAPGQSADFWSARARLWLDRLRTALLQLDAPASAERAPIAEALDACDRLAAAAERADGYVRDQQALLAGEVIFTEGRDLLRDIRDEVAASRRQIQASASERHSNVRREQIYLLAGAGGVLALVMLLLVPLGRTAPAQTSEQPREEPALIEVAPVPAPAATPAPQFDADDLADICRDIAAVAEGDQIRPLLDRTRALLDARGVIVWMSTPDRTELRAAAASGYDDRVIARIGSIAPTDSNLTADAFRDNNARANPGSRNAPAALAVPLPAPGGPAGVFSAELTPDAVLDEAKVSAAKLIAAQLGALLGAPNAKLPDEADAASSTEPVR